MKERRKDESIEEKIGWYYRHWQGMGLDRKSIKTYSVEPWNEQCIKDPLLNKALQPPKAKRQKTDQNSTGNAAVVPEETKTDDTKEPENVQECCSAVIQNIADQVAEPNDREEKYTAQ